VLSFDKPIFHQFIFAIHTDISLYLIFDALWTLESVQIFLFLFWFLLRYLSDRELRRFALQLSYWGLVCNS
ncbi:MAG: hypothetical protein ACK5S8_19760, partial [Pseudanabaena sp.]